jgi:hypothetical protein
MNGGNLNTELQKVALVTGADYHDHMPLNRYGLEEELAETVFFCAVRVPATSPAR